MIQKRVEIEQARQYVAVVERDLATLEQFVDFSSVRFNEKLSTTQLDAKSLTEVADFVMQRRRKLAEELVAAQRELTSKEAAFQGASETEIDARDVAYDLFLFVESNEDAGDLFITYRVNDVGWEPAYSVSCETVPNGDHQFRIQLDALVRQNSGEDWSNVSVAFCTGIPDTNSKPPLMAPFRVFADANQGEATSNPDPALWSPEASALEIRWGGDDGMEREIQLNEQAGRRQIFEINQTQGVQRVLAEDSMGETTEETYPVDSKLTLLNGPMETRVNVLSVGLAGEIYRVATPLISSYAYRQVTLTNPSNRALVTANASVFLNGDRVGRMKFPATPAGGKFQIGLGADRSVRTRRQLLKKEETVQGGNRVITLDYRLVVSNYYGNATEVRLFDRLPLPQDEEKIQVSLEGDREAALSTDPVYRRIDYPVGILRWDLEVPKQRFGSNAFDFDYQLKIELDRNESITNSNAMKQLETDLDFKRNGGGMGGMGGGIF